MPVPRMDLWRNRLLRFLLGAAPTLLSALLGIVRNKWLAHHLATAGFGTLVQVLAAMNWLGLAAGLGLGLPLTRNVAAARAAGDPAAERRVVHTAFTMVMVSAAVVGAGMLFAAPWISAAVLGTPAYASLVRISTAGAAGLALVGTLLALFAGHADVRAPVLLAAGGAGTATALTLLLVPRLGLTGAMVAASILYPAGFLVALRWARRRYATALKGPARFDSREAQTMLGVGGAGLLLGLLDQGTLLALRAHYVHAYGVAANGLLQAALALSQMVGSLFYAYLANYAFGVISGAARAAGDSPARAVRAYTLRQWPAIVLLSALLFGIAMVAAAPLLRLLYSNRFDPARPLMAWALLGEFGRVGMQVWTLGALPLGGMRLLAPVLLSYPVSLAVAYGIFSAAGMGLLSLPRAYTAAGACSLAVAMLLMGRRGVTPRGRDLLAFAAGGAFLAALAAWSLG